MDRRPQRRVLAREPAQLFAPPIIDPEYGYETVNVESQDKIRGSLLWWMKRTASRMRKRYDRSSAAVRPRVLATPIEPARVAYVRGDEQASILVVANLSPTVQPVELDLSAFNGLDSDRDFGLTLFPRIGREPYFSPLAPTPSYPVPTRANVPTAAAAAGHGSRRSTRAPSRSRSVTGPADGHRLGGRRRLAT